MKAIVYESGGVETLGISQVPDPVAGPGEVVVRVRACAMNHADVWGHKSEGPRFGGPRILGRDVAGVIEEVGEGVACWAKGDPVVVAPGVSCNVCFHCQHGQHSDCSEYGMLGAKVDGGYAELMKVSAMNLYPKPDNLSYEEAASIPLVFITAWRCLVEKARVPAWGVGAGERSRKRRRNSRHPDSPDAWSACGDYGQQPGEAGKRTRTWGRSRRGLHAGGLA